MANKQYMKCRVSALETKVDSFPSSFKKVFDNNKAFKVSTLEKRTLAVPSSIEEGLLGIAISSESGTARIKLGSQGKILNIGSYFLILFDSPTNVSFLGTAGDSLDCLVLK